MVRKLSASKSADANPSGANASAAGPRTAAIPFLDISAKTSWNAAISDLSQTLSIGHLGYFQGRLRNKLFSEMLGLFLRKKEHGFTRADLARRLGKRPEQVTRWLAGPGNLKIDTLSDLLLAMGHELVIEVRPIDNRLRADPETETAAQRHRHSSP
jgi:hypothetical protein